MNLNEYDEMVFANFRKEINNSWLLFLLPKTLRYVLADPQSSVITVFEAVKQTHWFYFWAIPALNLFSKFFLYTFYLNYHDHYLLQGTEADEFFIILKNTHPDNRESLAKVLSILHCKNLLTFDICKEIIHRIDARDDRRPGFVAFARDELVRSIELMDTSNLLAAHDQDDLTDIPEAQKNLYFILSHPDPKYAAQSIVDLIKSDPWWSEQGDFYRKILRQPRPNHVSFAIIACQKKGIKNKQIWEYISQCINPACIGIFMEMLHEGDVPNAKIVDIIHKMTCFDKLYNLKIWDKANTILAKRGISAAEVDILYDLITKENTTELVKYIKDELLVLAPDNSSIGCAGWSFGM